MTAGTGSIVLAEDNADQIELTLAALEEAGVLNPVDVVRDGVEMLDYLHRRNAWRHRTSAPPMLILMDVNMPRMNGVDALKEIKQHLDWCTIPVVMLTASQLDAERLRNSGVQANAYLVKPVDPKGFFTAMQSTSTFWLLVSATP
jgi:CheY-like chemotaxis protein